MRDGYQPKGNTPPAPPKEAESCVIPKYDGLKAIRTAPITRFFTFIRDGYALLVPTYGIAYVRIDDKCDNDGNSVYLNLSDGSCLSVTKEEYLEACERIQ